MNFPNAKILGIRLDCYTRHEALQKTLGMLKGCKAPQYIATPNLDFLYHVKKRPHGAASKVLQSTSLSLADGMPIFIAARLKGYNIPERITGVDFLMDLALELSCHQYSMYFLGGVELEIKTGLSKLNQICGDQIVSGTCFPDVDVKGQLPAHLISKTLDAINRSGAKVLVLSLGNPKQELFFSNYGPMLQTPVVIGVGGSLRMIGGKIKRAPQWIQSLGLEWCFRLWCEPTRLWQRYLRDMSVVPALILDILSAHFNFRIYKKNYQPGNELKTSIRKGAKTT